MKRILWIALALALALGVLWCGLALAEPATYGSCGEDVDWHLSDGVLTLMGTGPTYDYTGSDTPFAGDSRITSVVVGYGVTAIGDYLFSYCPELESVTLQGGTVESIGEFAFSSCGSLASVSLNSGLTTIGSHAFFNCSWLSSISFPTSLTSIGENAFMNCVQLGRVFLHDQVTSVGYGAFRNCTGLSKVTLPGSLVTIGDHAFESCDALTGIVIPGAVTGIGAHAFDNCRHLASVIIYNKDTTIGTGAFSYIPSTAVMRGWPGSTAQSAAATFGCQFSALYTSGSLGALTWSFNPSTGQLTISGTGSMVIPGDEDCPWNGFRSAIKKVVIGEGVTTICSRAFYNCLTMTEVSIPSTVTSISVDAFLSCPAVIRYTVTSGNEAYAGLSSGAIASRDGHTLILFPAGVSGTYSVPSGIRTIAHDAFQDSKLTSVTLPYGVTSIGDGAFSHATRMTGINLPSTVAQIGAYAFSGCSSLNSFSIPAQVSSIGTETFAECTALTQINIPAGVTTIGYRAFAGCRNLQDVTFHAGLQAIYDEAFTGCMKLDRVEIPYSVTSIGYYAFSGANGLVDVYIFNPETGIGIEAFEPNTVSLCIHGWIGSTADLFANSTVGFEFEGWEMEGSCGDNVDWAIDPSTMTLSITGTGAMWDYPNDYPSWFMTREWITDVQVGSGVTRVGSYAFYRMNALVSAVLPASLESIGEYAFGGCQQLSSVGLPDGVTSIGSGAFFDCRGLADANGFVIIRNVLYRYIGHASTVTVPARVTDISGSAFMQATGVTRINLPAGLKTIREYAFYDCPDLANITIPEGVTLVDRYAFCWCPSLADISIPESVAVIGDYAFLQSNPTTSILTSVVILNPLAEIGQDVFKYHGEGLKILGWEDSTAHTYATANSISFIKLPRGGKCGESVFWRVTDNTLIIYGAGDMTNYNASTETPWLHLLEDITAVEFRDGVTRVGNYACAFLNRLTDVTMADSVTAVGIGAFRGCSMTEVTIGRGVASVGSNVFRDAESLASISVAPGNTALCAVDGVLFSADMKSLYAYPPGKTDAVYAIPGTVTTLYTAAFTTCGQLRHIIVPASVRVVNNQAFYGCASLTHITFEGSAPSLLSNIFYNDTITAYFPAGDASWNASVWLNYGGMVSWFAFDAPDFYLPEGLTAIGDEAFSGIAAKGVVIPDSVTAIAGDPFSGSGVTTIYGVPGSAAQTLAEGRYAFYPIDDWLAAH